jgi:Protein of unknown function (DUF3306)
MSDSFLARWSRRKQDARRIERAPEPAEGATPATPDNEAQGAPAAVEEEAALTPEEIAELPKIEEITVETDISAFLRRGVPEALRNAALRRMWSLDPAIRDFVGEARDYSYDWNTPGGVPGSGELLPGQDVEAMLRGVFGESEPDRAGIDRSGVAPSRVRDCEGLLGAEVADSVATQQAEPESAQNTVHPEQGDGKKSKADNILTTANQHAGPAASQQGQPPGPHAVAARRHGGDKPV